MSRSRDIANFLGLTEIANTGNVRLLKFGEGTDSAQIINITQNTIDSNYVTARAGSGSGVTEVAAVSDLPTAADNAGQIYYVTNLNKFYFSNGSGWFKNDLINQDPSISVTPTGTINLSKTGQTSTYTIIGLDSGSLVFSVDSDGNFGGLASGVLTSNADSARFVVTPKAQGVATTTSSTLTFTVNDGVGAVSTQRQMNLNFSTAGQAADGSFSPSYTGNDSATNVTFFPQGGSTARPYGGFTLVRDKTPGKIAFGRPQPYGQSSTNYHGFMDYFEYDTNSQQFTMTTFPRAFSGYYNFNAVAIGRDLMLSLTNNSDPIAIYERTTNTPGTFYHMGWYNIDQLKNANSNLSSYSGSFSNDTTYRSGMDMSVDGLYMAFGATMYDKTGATNCGAVYIGKGSGSYGFSMTIEQIIENPFPYQNAYFGSSISMSTDGTWLAISDRSYASYAPRTSEETGGVYIYKRVANSGTSMYQLQKRIRHDNGESKFANQNYTGAVAYLPGVEFDSTGETLIIGTSQVKPTTAMYPQNTRPRGYSIASGVNVSSYNVGGVQVWKRDSDNALGDNSYSLFQEMYPDSVGHNMTGNTGTNSDYDFGWQMLNGNYYFGSSVAVSPDGNNLLVGAPGGWSRPTSRGGSSNNNTIGRVYIYSLDSAGGYTHKGDFFGTNNNDYLGGGGGYGYTSYAGGGMSGLLYLDNDIVAVSNGYSTTARVGALVFESA